MVSAGHWCTRGTNKTLCCTHSVLFSEYVNPRSSYTDVDLTRRRRSLARSMNLSRKTIEFPIPKWRCLLCPNTFALRPRSCASPPHRTTHTAEVRREVRKCAMSDPFGHSGVTGVGAISIHQGHVSPRQIRGSRPPARGNVGLVTDSKE
jgi:hypothetical protein